MDEVTNVQQKTKLTDQFGIEKKFGDQNKISVEV